MLQRRLCLATFALLCGSLVVPVASADNITIFNTGQSGGGSALAIGTADPHYSLVAAPATVPLTALATTPNPAWAHNTSTADWISPSSNGTDNWPVGNYDYQTTFSLTNENAATASLSGMWASDNNGCIYLNSVNTGDCTTFAAFGSLTAFSITSGFVAGSNTLDFIVTNGGGPTGVFAEVSGTVSPSSSVTPEPPAFILALTGACVAMIVGSKRRQAAG